MRAPLSVTFGFARSAHIRHGTHVGADVHMRPRREKPQGSRSPLGVFSVPFPSAFRLPGPTALPMFPPAVRFDVNQGSHLYRPVSRRPKPA